MCGGFELLDDCWVGMGEWVKILSWKWGLFFWNGFLRLCVIWWLMVCMRLSRLIYIFLFVVVVWNCGSFFRLVMSWFFINVDWKNCCVSFVIFVSWCELLMWCCRFWWSFVVKMLLFLNFEYCFGLSEFGYILIELKSLVIFLNLRLCLVRCGKRSVGMLKWWCENWSFCLCSLVF